MAPKSPCKYDLGPLAQLLGRARVPLDSVASQAPPSRLEPRQRQDRRLGGWWAGETQPEGMPAGCDIVHTRVGKCAVTFPLLCP
eukprot:6201531-Pleurochrysis_carterae.AAC.1